jgi:endonuclease G, mitochondrial
MRILLLAAAFAAGLGLSLPASAAPSSCPANFFGGQAPDLVNGAMAKKAKELCFSEFAMLHSGLTRTPLWSADHLTANRVALARRQHRKNSLDTFHEETSLPPDERATLQDYARSGYDRGHMSPNGDMDNAEAQAESFTLANMVPQNPDNNRGIWSDVEASIRSIARQYREVWVVTIPIFSGSQTHWLHDRVAIPVKIAKAVFIPSLNAASAYVTDNADGRNWQAVSIADLRAMSGIDPFPSVPERVKQTLIQLPEAFGPGSHGREHADTTKRSPGHVGTGRAYHLLRTLMR